MSDLVNTIFFPEPQPRDPYAVPERPNAHPEHEVHAQKARGVPTFVLEDVTDFSTIHSRPLPDITRPRVVGRTSF